MHIVVRQRILTIAQMSFRLNEKEIIKKVLEGIPPQEIQFVAYNFPLVYIQRYISAIFDVHSLATFLDY